MVQCYIDSSQFKCYNLIILDMKLVALLCFLLLLRSPGSSEYLENEASEDKIIDEENSIDDNSNQGNSNDDNSESYVEDGDGSEPPPQINLSKCEDCKDEAGCDCGNGVFRVPLSKEELEEEKKRDAVLTEVCVSVFILFKMVSVK